ncbi:XRE family transcriptional regulator [Longispora sp. K20-0274]|uniref:XRE family transcriptional regulator n=1 Tax=Longispora sp. K20-0274 TaxID=3088255 RepID=UPI00399B732C
MPNERLRSALAAGGHTIQALADALKIDHKTAQRWVARDVVPHRKTAIEAADFLGQPVSHLWPKLGEAAPSATATELVGYYPHRSATPKQLWLDLLRGAEREIGLLAYASLFLPEDNPEAISLLKAKAAAGVRVRIALGDPASPEAALRGVEERLYDAIPGRISMALAYYRPLLGVPGVEFHLHRTTLYNSIFQYDDQMLVNTHVYGVYGYMAPIVHLRRVEGEDLFDTYAGSFERIWEVSYPYRPELPTQSHSSAGDVGASTAHGIDDGARVA